MSGGWNHHITVHADVDSDESSVEPYPMWPADRDGQSHTEEITSLAFGFPDLLASGENMFNTSALSLIWRERGADGRETHLLVVYDVRTVHSLLIRPPNMSTTRYVYIVLLYRALRRGGGGGGGRLLCSGNLFSTLRY